MKQYKIYQLNGNMIVNPKQKDTNEFGHVPDQSHMLH